MTTTKRAGLSLAGFFQRYPDNQAAEAQFEAWRWPDGPECPHCASTNIATVKNRRPMPYRCRTCRKHFSVTVGTVMQSTKFPLQTWLLAVYLLSTDAKGRASTKLGRDLDVRQSTAWHLAHRIRKAMAAADTGDMFADRFRSTRSTTAVCSGTATCASASTSAAALEGRRRSSGSWMSRRTGSRWFR